MSTSALALITTNQVPPAVVVYGLDSGNKFHASVFAESDADLAEIAAGLMGMRAFRLTHPDHLAAVAGLPHGRIFSGGRAFVPFAKGSYCDRLTALGGAPNPKPSTRAAGPRTRPEKSKAAATANVKSASTEAEDCGAQLDSADSPSSEDRADPFAIGTVVLAPELVMSWWEAVIVGVNGDDITLTWRDFSSEAPFSRKRHQIASLPNGYVPPV